MKEKVKFATAFGMKRCKMGYVVKEKLIFALTEDEKKNKEKIKEFAKETKCELVEVWYREDEKWDEIKFHKAYTFYTKITEKIFNELKN